MKIDAYTRINNMFALPRIRAFINGPASKYIKFGAGLTAIDIGSKLFAMETLAQKKSMDLTDNNYDYGCGFNYWALNDTKHLSISTYFFALLTVAGLFCFINKVPIHAPSINKILNYSAIGMLAACLGNIMLPVDFIGLSKLATNMADLYWAVSVPTMGIGILMLPTYISAGKNK